MEKQLILSTFDIQISHAAIGAKLNLFISLQCQMCNNAIDRLWSILCSLWWLVSRHQSYGSLIRYVKLWVAHTPGITGTFSQPPRISDPDMHHDPCVTLVSWCMPGSLARGYLWNKWWGKHSRHSRHMFNPQIYVSGQRPMGASVMIYR